MTNGGMTETTTPLSPRGRSTFHFEPRSCPGSKEGFVLEAVPMVSTTTAACTEAECGDELIAIWKAFLSTDEQQYFAKQGFGSCSGPELRSPLLEKTVLPSEGEFIGSIALQALKHQSVAPLCPPTATGVITLAADVLCSASAGEDRTPRIAVPPSGPTPTAVKTCPGRLAVGRHDQQDAKLRFTEDFCWRLLTCRLVRSTAQAKKKRLPRRRRIKDNGSQCGASNSFGGVLDPPRFALLVTSLNCVALDLLIKLAELSLLECLSRETGQQRLHQSAALKEGIIISCNPRESLADVWAAFCDMTAIYSNQPTSSCDETVLLQAACLGDSPNQALVLRKAIQTSRELLMSKWLRLMSLLCPDHSPLPFPASHRLVPYRDVGLGLVRQWTPRTFGIFHHLIKRLDRYFEADELRPRIASDQMPIGGDFVFLLVMCDTCIRALLNLNSAKSWLSNQDCIYMHSYLSLLLLLPDTGEETAEVAHTTTPVRKPPTNHRCSPLPLPSLPAEDQALLQEDCFLALQLISQLILVNSRHVEHTNSKRQTFRMKRDLMIKLLDRVLILYTIGRLHDPKTALTILAKGLELVRQSYLVRSALHLPHATSAQTASTRRKRCGCIGPCSREISPICGSNIWPEVARLLKAARAEKDPQLSTEIDEWERLGLAKFPRASDESVPIQSTKQQSLFDKPAFAFGVILAAVLFAYILRFAFIIERNKFNPTIISKLDRPYISSS